MIMYFDRDTVKNVSEGEVFILAGKSYKLLIKRSKCIEVSRYYWFDKLFDKLVSAFKEGFNG